MSEKKKRKVNFNLEEDGKKKAKSEGDETRLRTGKYALDSDEEDDEEQAEHKEMNPNELGGIGQEPTTIGFDDDVKITPFNIDEELEDGHYDEQGCFRWKKKDKDDIRDAWLDEIDWTNVKNYKLKNESKDDTTDDPHSSQTEPKEFNEMETLKAILLLMQPGESVVRTIKRLGAAATIPKEKQQGKQRRLLPGEVRTSPTPTPNAEELKKKKWILEEMSGLADQFVSNGQLDIYQETYERLKSKLQRLQSSLPHPHTTENSAFDMYADSDITTSIQTSQSSKTDPDDSAIVLWEYTTDESSPHQLQGPFTTEQIIRLSNTEGKLDREKVRCRRCGTQQFYSIKRIDFDLYLD